MKTCLTTLLAAVLSAGACAGTAPPAQSDLPPPVLRDKGMKPLLRVREQQFKNSTSAGFPNTVACRIRYVDKYFGYLKDSDYYRQGKMPFQSACYDAKEVEWLNEMPLRLDTERRGWVPDIEKRLQWAASTGGQEGVDPDYRELRRNALRAYTVKSVNAQGFAFTEEDVTGEEKWRTRFIEYCLFHAEVALCGRGEVGYVAQGPRGDLTDYVLQILRSIEFLPNDPSVAPPAASAASAASASGH
jgi:hypothetical protein